MRVVIAVTVVLLAGCGGPTASAIPAPNNGQVVGTQVDFIAASCAGSTYVRCVQSLTSAAVLLAGSTVAICEYSGGEGDVVTVDAGETPEAACSGGGLITPSRVHATVGFPKK